MVRFFVATVVTLLTWLPPATGWAEEVSKEQIKGLDEQVQEIKTDALGIAAELNRLEEKLLYPSNTQVSLFISLAPGTKFRLDAVEIQIDGKPVTRYLYALKELEALQGGGVQRIYTGNIRKGEHDLQVSVSGKSTGGGELHQTASFKLNKDVAPKLVGITLSTPGSASPSISFKDW
jgi:hypothetical protein